MRPVLFLTAFLSVLFAATISATVIVASRLDPSPEDLPFSDCRLPCFAGATIGQTGPDTAIPQMAKRFEPLGYGVAQRLWDGHFLAVNWVKPNVSSINVSFTGEALTGVGLSI